MPNGIRISLVHGAGFSGQVVTDSPLHHALNGGLSPQYLFQLRHDPLKTDQGIRAALLYLPVETENDAECAVFAKEYAPKGRLHGLRTWLNGGRAPRVWRMAYHLSTAGVPVARPLAYLVRKTAFGMGTGYYFCEALLGARDLRMIAQHPQQLRDLLQRQGLLEALATGIAALHQTGTSHGDMKWGNIMVNEASGQLWFIDLDAAKFRSGRYGRAMAKDIARFVLNAEEAEVSRDNIEHFIDCYAQARALPFAQVKAGMQPLLKKLRERHRRKQGTYT